MKNIKISVALATYNEEKNLDSCLESVKNFASEIVIVDGTSNDNTIKIARKFGAKVIITTNKINFHINKQMAIDNTTGDWILFLDADERVSNQLAKEILNISEMSDLQINNYEKSLFNKKLFDRHIKIIEKRDGTIGDNNKNYSAFFIPRRNFFMGRYLMHGGVYPDGVIRFFKKGEAYLPARDVHEQMKVLGRIGWLQNDLLHFDSPTFNRYYGRWERYTTFIAGQLKDEKLPKNIFSAFNYCLIKPMNWFLLTYFRHKGFMDGYQGFIFSFFSSLRFARAYLKYLKS